MDTTFWKSPIYSVRDCCCSRGTIWPDHLSHPCTEQPSSPLEKNDFIAISWTKYQTYIKVMFVTWKGVLWWWTKRLITQLCGSTQLVASLFQHFSLVSFTVSFNPTSFINPLYKKKLAVGSSKQALNTPNTPFTEDTKSVTPTTIWL